MRKIILSLMLCVASLFGNNELLLDSANAYQMVLRANDGIPAANLVEKSSAIIIFPRVVKAGFILGGIVGKGTMLVKNGDSWHPKGVKIGGGSIGLQAGYEDSYLVLYILKSSIVKDIEDAKFTFQADASVSFGSIGANTAKISDISFSKDIYAYSNNSGYFAGAKLGGTVIGVDEKIKFDVNSYGFNSLIQALNLAN
ncbi:putative lipid-binding protein (SYLF/DUF500 domain) [Campylobacter iguaniorum]|uniref:lipid-binding SYLF domain-containing protein n=1 Tax=Campylobacter iguaniorum TaxID=1244531 RepID=UPI0007C97ACB|nr:lipid-binding SYLF domain-containing protein [Campylobacter iguaniorum]ANE35592.1 putative lipid-binding protein (SYLF/DUF500 domain) [Campylobacter iguaniorum]